MNIDKYEKIRDGALARASYYERIDFPNLANTLREAGIALGELIDTLKKIDASEEAIINESEDSQKTSSN